MDKILKQKVQIVTMGENVKNLICLVDSEIKRLEKLAEETTDSETGKELFVLGANYYKSLREELQKQLESQI